MTQPSFRPRIVVVGVIGVSIAIAISSFSVVRAQRFAPLGSISYTCKGTKGSACVTGNSTGQSWGVLGASTHNHGVLGESAALGKAGVAGYSLATGQGGFGVYAESADTTGKYAALGVQGDNANTSLLYAYSHANRASCLIDPSANLTCTGTLTGITSLTTGKAGVAGVAIGTSGSGNGVTGVSSNGFGVEGQASAQGSAGVYGQALNGPGIYGVDGTTNTPYSYGVQGVDKSGNSAGVFGQSAQVGVAGETTATGAGVIGLATSTNSAIALSAMAENSANYIFYGIGPGASFCTIDASANLTCTGTVKGGVNVQSQHRTSTGRRVLAYASQSTSATIEDFGTAQMIHGVANVQIEPTFASTIDRNTAYYVFLTPLGDTRGLYVSVKTPSGFQVRETQGGRSSIGFDYRVVAHPVDADNARLPQVPPFKGPRIPHISIPSTINGQRPVTHP